MNAEELAIDPVAAAHRLLGATIAGRGVRAMVVEVEAYGGVPDGPWPDAAAHSYRGRNGRNDVMFAPGAALHLPQPWDPCLCQRRVRARWHGCRCAT